MFRLGSMNDRMGESPLSVRVEVYKPMKAFSLVTSVRGQSPHNLNPISKHASSTPEAALDGVLIVPHTNLPSCVVLTRT